MRSFSTNHVTISSSLHILGFEITWDMSFFMGISLVALVILFSQLRTSRQPASIENLENPIERPRNTLRTRYLLLIFAASFFVSAFLGWDSSTKSVGEFTGYGLERFYEKLRTCKEPEGDVDDVDVTLVSFLVTVDGRDILFRRSEDGKFRDGLGHV